MWSTRGFLRQLSVLLTVLPCDATHRTVYTITRPTFWDRSQMSHPPAVDQATSWQT